jgi:hypothetical protein
MEFFLSSRIHRHEHDAGMGFENHFGGPSIAAWRLAVPLLSAQYS